MTDIAALEAQKKAISDQIAALMADQDRHALGFTLPSAGSIRLKLLRSQLATVTMKLTKARKAAG